jgi:membrane-bound lytic murein transglycosylase MltF
MQKVNFIIIWFYLVLTLTVSGCNEYPKDPNGTINKVRDGILVIGYSDNPPWVIKTNQDPEGIEPELIKMFASGLNAEIKWQNGTEQQLFQKLEEEEIDVLIAGITEESPWQDRRIGLTRHYVQNGKDRHVIAVQQGENSFLMKLEEFLHGSKSKVEEMRRK